MYNPEYTADYMYTYRLPSHMGSYDVGIKYNSYEDKQLVLHDNIVNLQTNVNMYLNEDREGLFKIYFRNNTALRCEALIFITHCETECLGYASNSMIIVPDKPYFIGKCECLDYASNHMVKVSDKPYFIGKSGCSDKCYRFVPNYVYGENESVDLNSYITVLVYPEIENALWHYKYGFKRNYKNLYYTYKFKLVHYQKCKEIEHYVI